MTESPDRHGGDQGDSRYGRGEFEQMGGISEQLKETERTNPPAAAPPRFKAAWTRSCVSLCLLVKTAVKHRCVATPSFSPH